MNPWFIPLTLPTLLQGWLVGLLSLTLGFSQHPSVRRGVLITFWRPWFAKRWRYSTTLGAWMGMHPNHGQRTEFHEGIHIQQYESLNCLSAMLSGIIIGVGAIYGGEVFTFAWKLGLILWAFSGMLWLLPNFLIGLIRYGNGYYGSDHERMAYCCTAIETARDGRPIGIGP